MEPGVGDGPAYRILNLLSTVTGLVFLGVFSLFLQRRLFHPLRKYPGPWLNSWSEVPAAIALASGRQQAYYRRLHIRFGEIVRVAPNELSFANPKAWEDIYNRKAPHMEKSGIFIGAVAKIGAATGISMAPIGIKDHSRHRRALGYSFTTSALLQQQEIILTQVRKLISCLKRLASSGKDIDMTDWYTYATFDLMGDLTFGKTFGCLDEEGPTDWSRAIIQVFISGAWEQSIRRNAGINTSAETVLKKLLVPKKAAMWRQLHFSKSIEATKQRIKDGERDHKDLMYFVLKNKEARQDLSDQELMINMVLLISAGSETTTTTLTAWTYFVCTNKSVYKRLAAEIRTKFQVAEDIIWENVQPDRLPYLEATIKETLRLIPPSATSLQRIVPPGGAVICGEHIDEGYTVAVPSAAITRLDTNFAEATQFRPQRWLPRIDPSWDGKFANDRLEASQPFLIGPRVCIGKQLAYFELRLILTNMLWHFDMELANEVESKEMWSMKDDMKNVKGYLTWVKPGLPVRLYSVKREA